MRFSRSLVCAAFTTMLALPLAASEGEIEYREHTMEAVGGHMQAIVDILKQKVPFTSHLALHANALADLSEIAPTLFPEGSEGGDALPEIWEDVDDFAERLMAFEEAANDLQATIAGGGEMGAVGAAVQSLGQACKGCHDNFRDE